MDQQILQSESAISRKQILRDSADKLEEFTYPRALGHEEVTQIKDEFSKNAVKVAKLEETKAEFMTQWKADVKPIKQEMGAQISKIRTNVEEVTEEVFLISDQDQGVMGYYNSEGILVYKRPLMPEERQMTIVDKAKITG